MVLMALQVSSPLKTFASGFTDKAKVQGLIS